MTLWEGILCRKHASNNSYGSLDTLDMGIGSICGHFRTSHSFQTTEAKAKLRRLAENPDSLRLPTSSWKSRRRGPASGEPSNTDLAIVGPLARIVDNYGSVL